MMQQITVKQLKEKLADHPDLYLLDVREEYEHENFNIGGVLIPLAEIMTKAIEIPDDRPVILYCQKGIRSQIAIQRLEQKFHFTNLINLQGGIEKWDL
jgi:rhodanese-related sulfurtransferase